MDLASVAFLLTQCNCSFALPPAWAMTPLGWPDLRRRVRPHAFHRLMIGEGETTAAYVRR